LRATYQRRRSGAVDERGGPADRLAVLAWKKKKML